MAVEFVGHDVPARRSTTSREWDEIAEKLRAQPGEWAIVARHPRYAATTSIYQGLQRRRLDVARRKLTTDEFAVYARWPEVA